MSKKQNKVQSPQSATPSISSRAHGRTSNYRPDTPRRVRNGIKLHRKDTLQPENWVAQRWLEWIKRTFSESAREKGLEYAQQGQTAAIELQPGKVEARVQGRTPRAYRVSYHFHTLEDGEWDALIAAMAAEAIYVAKLLAGEMPANLESLFNELDLHLLPANPESVSISCTCGHPARCKHAATIATLLIDRLSDDPLTAFTFGGLSAPRVLDRLRQARLMHTQGAAAAHSDPLIPETQKPPKPLEQCVDSFWRSGQRLAELEQAPPPQHVAHALLRRLGPPPMGGRFPLVGLLASIYDTVAEDAIRLRNEAEDLDSQDTGESRTDSLNE